MSSANNHEESPQPLPRLGKIPPPPDDRPEAGMSLGEMLKDRIGEITTGMDDLEPTAAAGDDVFLKDDASKKDKAKKNFTRVTSLSYDEVDPS
ncbi:MAG: hypothetical protein JL56_12160 [Desulfotomaculum sp. BICA1-6]|nr:MAG: hypothetical protein VR67_16950 [Peptococcaceae bacterium BRH_c8a]KJS72724.1 MAG: hypothetical protein JL56_12160 [Desulfotomaculum sp. BICA1-6]